MDQPTRRRRFAVGVLFPLLLAGCASPPTVGLSPDGSRLAIARGGSAPLVLVDSQGRQSTPLEATEGGHDPVWSPRGDVLLFLQPGDAESEDAVTLERITAYDVRQQRTLPLAEGGAAPLSWSPDGKRFLALAPVEASEEEGASLVEARWYRYPEGDVEARLRLPLMNVPNNVSPIWLSPEGRVALVGASTEGQDLWIVSPEGARAVTTTHDVVGAALTPDSSALLWARVPEGAPGDGLSLWALRRVDGSVRALGSPRLVPAPHGDDSRPLQASFSPDGRSLGILVNTAAGPQVYAGRLAERALRRVVTSRKPPRADTDSAPSPTSFSLAWSGNGSRLAVVSSDPTQPLRLFNPDTGSRRGISIVPVAANTE